MNVQISEQVFKYYLDAWLYCRQHGISHTLIQKTGYSEYRLQKEHQ